MHRLLALIADVALVILFAGLGRASHAHGLSLGEIINTSLPFLAGTLLAWILCVRWPIPVTSLKAGAIIWLCTLVFGIGLRAIMTNRAPFSFIVVAALVLALFLVGWRLINWLMKRNKAAS